MLESYFSIGVSLLTWFGDEVAIQISGKCPAANRDKQDLQILLSKQEERMLDFNQDLGYKTNRFDSKKSSVDLEGLGAFPDEFDRGS